MATTETLSTFIRNLPSFSNAVKAGFLNSWNKNTQYTLAESNKKIPVASGNLLRSGDALEAKLTSNGIVSSIVYKVPYAQGLNDVNSGLKLKEAGELSYLTPGGTKVNKRQKGELGYLDKAIKETANQFVDDISDIISKEWAKL